MNAGEVWFGIGALLVARFGIVVGTVCLPVAASFLLDGVVQFLRGDGAKVFLSALALVVVLAGGGYALWQFGTGSSTVSSATQARMETVAHYVIVLSTVLALVGFVVRTVKMLREARRAADRMQFSQMSRP